MADSSNEGLLLLGRRQAKAPPSAMHPLGHGRPTYFWSFIVALLLFSIGGVASIYEGLRNVAVKAQMRDTANSRELMQVIRDSEAGLKAEFPQVRWVFFEPVAASDSADS